MIPLKCSSDTRESLTSLDNALAVVFDAVMMVVDAVVNAVVVDIVV